MNGGRDFSCLVVFALMIVPIFRRTQKKKKTKSVFVSVCAWIDLGCRIGKVGASTAILVQQRGESPELARWDTEVRCQRRSGQNTLASPAHSDATQDCHLNSGLHPQISSVLTAPVDSPLDEEGDAVKMSQGEGSTAGFFLPRPETDTYNYGAGQIVGWLTRGFLLSTAAVRVQGNKAWRKWREG